MQQPLDLGEMEGTSTISVLYQRHAPGIFSYLRLHIPSREDAEDLLVDAFLAACMLFAHWSPDGKSIRAIVTIADAPNGPTNKLVAFDVATGKQSEVTLGLSGQLNQVAWSPNSKYIAAGEGSGDSKISDVRVWVAFA